jgi:nucleotide-binding universal stress UspA family protein
MFVDADASREKEEGAARILDHAREICAQAQLADAEFEAVEGDARNVLCEAVDRHAADLLAVGSHGYGAIKRHHDDSSRPLHAFDSPPSYIDLLVL